MLAKYSISNCNLKRIKANFYIFCNKDEKQKLELMMSVHVDDAFVAEKEETLKNIKENNRYVCRNYHVERRQ